MDDQQFKELKQVQREPINRKAKMFLDKTEPADEMMIPSVLYLLQKQQPKVSLPKLTNGAQYYAILVEIQRLSPQNIMKFLGLTQPYSEEAKEAMKAKTELEMAEILLQNLYERIESQI